MLNLSKTIETAINKQINAEFWSAYLYLSMSVHFEAEGKSGFAHWFKKQFEEEQSHARRLMDYVLERDGKVTLEPIQAVKHEWKSPLDAFKESLQQEGKVTDSIYNLVTLARNEKDYATENMLQWFVDEQLEEESSVQTLIDQLTLIGDNGFGIYTFDKGLLERED